MKLLRLLSLALWPVLLSAQTTKIESQLKDQIRSYMNEKKSEWKITDKDITDWSVSDLASNPKTRMTYVYVQQEVNGIRIFNAVSSVSFKNNKLSSFAKRLYPDALSKINTASPSLSTIDAIKKTAEHLSLTINDTPKLVLRNKALHRFYYSSSVSPQSIRVELVYQPVKNTLRLAWDVNIKLKDKSNWWNVRIDAANGEVLEKNDWTTHCDFGAPLGPVSSPQANSTVAPANSAASLAASYRVYPLPLEAPSFGPSVLLNDPSDPVSSPFGWHDTNGITGPEFTITRGNNVFAYDDIANIDAPGTSPDGTASLTFDFPINFSQAPGTYLDASITNLFYLNNMMHDRLVHFGFDEVFGNFQAKNYSNLGAGNDYVLAECQDGGGTNNANFATPPDGTNGRMQMYLWTGNVTTTLVVNSPGSIAGSYNSSPAGFGPAVVVPITGDFVLADDGTGDVNDACESLINGPALSGKIAIINRGTCNFVDKVLSAQTEGALAVVVINNAGGIFAMGDNGNGGSVTIPSVMISQSDGAIIKNAMGTGTVNGTLNPPPSTAVDVDGSLDNGVVMHEYGHGVSTRLTGGASNSNCLNNAEEGGEGWSDYFALLFTMKPGDAGPDARGMGTYALGQPTSGSGIRRYPYSTNMSVNPLTYGDIAASPEVHDIGEIWCVTLWEMTWSLIDSFGFDPSWTNDTTGNYIALSLVIDGMKLQPCGPGFLDARDAIISADNNLYGGKHVCMIWAAFAKRGMGFSAIEGIPNDGSTAGDETEAFDLPPICLIATAPPIADFVSDIQSSCFGTIHFTDHSTSTPQGWRWKFGDGGTDTLQNPVHTYTTSGMFTVTLTVTNTLGVDSLVRTSYITISRPPAPTVTGDTTICNATGTILTATTSPGNDAEWRDDNDSVVFSGTVFTTPILTTSTTYHLTQFASTPVQNVGPPDSSIGGGGNHATGFEGKELFTTVVPVRIKSVWVDAQGAAIRNFNLYSGNTLLQTKAVMVPNGASRVNLGFEILNAGNYSLGVSAPANLYRNQNGATYPYTIPGLLSIYISNSTQNPNGAYYYCYDWEVQELPCPSDEVLVNVSVDPIASHFTFNDNGLTVNFTNTSTGNPASILWDFGNGQTSTQANPTMIYSTTGNYTVSLTITGTNGCQSVTAQVITVSGVGIEEIANNWFDVYYTGHDMTVKFNSQPDNARIKIYDSIGKLIIDDQFKSGLIYTKQLKNIASEFIMVDIVDGDKKFSKKFVIVH